MLDFLKNFFSSDFMPRGHCYFWNPEIVWLHVLSDSIIALAYYSIPITLVYFVRKRRDLPFPWIFVMFGGFIVACGATHLMEVWTVWHGTYRLSGFVKVVTGVLSIVTAVLLVKLVPQALLLRSPTELTKLNELLAGEIGERKSAEAALLRAQEQLELRVQERTEELAKANAALKAEVDKQQRTETALRENEKRFRALAETTPSLIVIHQEGRIRYANPAAETILGFAIERLQQMNFWEVIHPDFCVLVKDRGLRREQGESLPNRSEFKIVTQDNQERWLDCAAAVIEFEDKPAVLATAFDITERKKAEDAHQESLGRFRQIAENIGEVFYVSDVVKGEMLYISPAYEEIWGRSCYSLYKNPQSFLDAVQPEFRDRVSMALERQFRGEATEEEYLIRRPDGKLRWIRDLAFPLRDKSGKVYRITGIAEDITQGKQVEASLRESNARKAAILESALDCIITIDHQGRILEFNPAAEQTFGYTKSDVVGKEMAALIIPPAYREKHRQGLARYLATGESPVLGKRLEMIAMRADGTEFPIELAITRIGLHRPPLFTGFVRDITERSRAEEMRNRFISIVESSGDAIIGKTLDGTITSWNSGAERIYGYSVDEVRGKSICIIIPRERLHELAQFQEKVSRGVAVRQFETVRLTKDRGPIHVSLTTSPIFDATGRIVGSATIARDVGERKRYEEQITASLHEKEILLKEIHHRVKNNLQIICSLLSLQRTSTDDQPAQDLLRECQTRIRSMALIHEKLYQTKDFSRIDFADYLNSLLAMLFRSYGAKSGVIKSELHLDQISLGIDAAIPVGLITHELVSNCLKHAFPGGRAGTVQIELNGDQEKCFRLTVSDNGVGLPHDFRLENTSTLGLRVIKILTEQIGGRLEVQSQGGTRFLITFSENQIKERN